MGGGSVCRIKSLQPSGRAVSLLRYLMPRTEDSRPLLTLGEFLEHMLRRG